MTPPPRLRRLAQELARGEEILWFLSQPGPRAALRAAVGRGLPAADDVGSALLGRFGPLMLERRHRLYVAMLAEWLAAQPDAAAPADPALAEQLVAALDTPQLQRLVQVAQAALRARFSPP